MNVYFTSTNLAWLTEVNGRGFTARHTTKQWGAIHKHPDRDEWCVEIDYLARLGEVVSGQELQDMQAHGPFDRARMIVDGWFEPEPEQPGQ